MSLSVLTAVPDLTAAPRWRDRVCARLGGWCDLLRKAHLARIPF